jgi:hypothetical protein
MIRASFTGQAVAELARQLTMRARQLGAQRAATRARKHREQRHRWRSAATLWPGFGQEQR